MSMPVSASDDLVRGSVYRITSRASVGHEQRGARYAIVVQSQYLPLSTRLVVPTSTSARGTVFRPEVDWGRGPTRAMCDQLRAMDLQLLGSPVGMLRLHEMIAIDEGLRIVLGWRT